MATFQVFAFFKGALGDGSVDLDTNSFFAYLSNAQPDKDNAKYKSQVAEISGGNGYTLGGVALTSVTWTQQAGSPQGIWVFDSADFSWTASGGSIGPAQYVVIYGLGAGSPNNNLVGYVDYGTTFTITDGNSLNVTVGSGFFDLSGG